MNEYIFTQKGYEALLKKVRETKELLNQAIRLKSEAGSGQDGWHDEGFKLGVTEETMWDKRLIELQDLCSNAQVIDPKEQNDIVGLGTGVILEYEDGSTFKFILEGYAVEMLEGRVSIHSPLGRTILGAKEGEKRSFQVGATKKTVMVKKILPPSMAETLFQEGTKDISDKKNSQPKT